MQPLLSLSYWFSLTPPPFLPWVERMLLVVFAVLLLAGIAGLFYVRYSGYGKFMKRALSRASSHLGWTGIAGLVLWMFSYERIPLFSMRAAYVAWFAWLVIGAYFVGRYVWVEIPAMEAKNRERFENEKWLPKRK